MRCLVECLQELIYANEHWALPTLVLGGDVLELALADEDVAAMMFERFMELVLMHSEPLFDDTVYFIPGNHDHHLWEGAREAHYAKSVRGSDKSQQRTLDPPRHATHLIASTDKDPWNAPLLEALVHREPELRNVKVHTMYPNFAVVDDEGARAVVFHHGHYAESLYRLVSTITGMMFPDKKRPQEVHEWEEENFAWVDFFWSTLGRSGGAGDDIGLAYNYLQSDVATEYLVANLAAGFVEHSDHDMVRRVVPLVEPALRRLTRHVIARERAHPGGVLRADTESGLAEYVEGPLRRQLARACNDDIPEHVTFVFGHTHKPFVSTRAYAGYHERVSIANTGGWVVDTVDPNPLHGAAVILLDEDLNAVSLKLYSQQTVSGRYSVEAMAIPSTGGNADEFLQRVQGIIDSDREPWSRLSTTAERVVRARSADLQRILARADAVGQMPPGLARRP
jgi:hypothetical protein